MIISASRRTDIPAYYSEWFVNRIREEFLYVRNPLNIHQIGKIRLSRDVVDGIVFWTKNPIPLMSKLDAFKEYLYYFQFTLTGYGKEIETGLPSKNQELIPAFCDLSKRVGRERVVWRYDPIFLSDKYTIGYHKEIFEQLISKLGNYTEKCTVSFLDLYKNTERNLKSFGIRVPTRNEQIEIINSFVEIAKEYEINIDTCAEENDFSEIGVNHACCIDKERLERIGGIHLEVKKDPNQRSVCGCAGSIDIGTYNTCKNGCVYCYANYNSLVVEKQVNNHNPFNPLLFGTVECNDEIKERKMESCIRNQLTIFDI